MLRQTRRKTITIEAARTFPEQNLPSSRSRLLRQTTRTRTEVFSELLLLWLREAVVIEESLGGEAGQVDLEDCGLLDE
ncbi:unnamed protein product [Sphagnum troendelagicum]